jgi:hypothetical protein
MGPKKDNFSSSLYIESSLQVFFFDQLTSLNQKSTQPVPSELIFYSSKIMDKFGDTSNLFEEREGKVSEKILGTKLLEANHLEANKKKRILKDVGDTALIICGYFSDSLNRKIVDASYYEELGRTAYNTLDNYVPSVYDVDSFYKRISLNFSLLTNMMSIISKNVFNSQESHLLILNQKIKVS